MHKMRLDKYLTDCNLDSRSNCKKYIKSGRITVNGNVIKDNSLHIDEEDEVCFDGQCISYFKNIYYMFHKPTGCICATSDPDQKTVLSYFPQQLHKKLRIVGRLDKDTEGLLLLTDDGDFVHHLMSPKKHVDKTYYFTAEGVLIPEAVEMVKSGVDIGDDKLTNPATLEIISNVNHVVEGMLTISEGRYHQVKRMVKVLGAEVTYLKRISIGKLTLDSDLDAGSYRELTKQELIDLNYGREK